MKHKEGRTVVFRDARGKLKVSEQLLRFLRDALLFIHPGMVPGIGYTAEELLGPEIWNPWGPGLRRFIGRCLSWMERRRLLPIRRVTPMGKYPVRYAR